MQMLCHYRSAACAVTRKACCALRYGALLLGAAWGWVALAEGPAGASPQDKVQQACGVCAARVKPGSA